MLTLAFLSLLALGMRLYRLKDLPPGLFHDEAYNALDAQALAEGLSHPRFYDSWEVYARTIHTTWPPPETRFPVFLEGNYGREALFHYLGAVAVILFGPRVWALRLVAALMGALCVPIAFFLTRELFADPPERAVRLALLTAAVVTGIYVLLVFSRMGLRIIMLLTLEGLTVAFWWHAGRNGRLRWWALAGLLLGLAQYTYIPARVLPFVVVFPVLVWVLRRAQLPGGQHRRLMRGALLALLVALVVAAPLIQFFVRYPAYLTLRAEAVSADSPERGLGVMIANLGRILGGLVWRGDPNPILNLPGRPLFDGVQAVFFCIGVIVCLRQVRRLVHAFLLVWAVALHLPSVVSGIAPTFGRSIGGILPVTIITAVGMETMWTSVGARWPRRRPLATLAIVAGLVFSIGLTARDYFVVWAQLPDLPRTFHEEMAVIGRYIRGLPEETVVYITPTQTSYATLLQAMGKRDRPHDFYGPAGLLPVGDPYRETVYLILEGDEATAATLESVFPAGDWDNPTTAFYAYRVLPSADRIRPQHVIQADLANTIRLIGCDISPAEVRSGDTISVRITWQALERMNRRYTAFVHLLGPADPVSDSPLWAQDDHEPGQATYTTDRWFPGEVVMDTFHLQIPADAPAGEYVLSTGFYDLETLQRLPRSDAEGDTVVMTTITLVE